MQAAQLASDELQTAQELLRGRKGPGACQAVTARSLSLHRMQVLHLGRAMLLQGAGQAGGAAHCHPLPAAGGRSRVYHIGLGKLYTLPLNVRAPLGRTIPRSILYGKVTSAEAGTRLHTFLSCCTSCPRGRPSPPKPEIRHGEADEQTRG